MEIVDTPADVKPLQQVDYTKLVTYYNNLEIGQAVKLDKVSNITLFKNALSRRGVKVGTDAQAFTHGDHTFVKRLTTVEMKKD